MNLIKENKLIPDQDYTDDESIKKYTDDSIETRYVQWSGEKFLPKPLSPSRLDLVKLRNPHSFKDKNIKVKYSKASLSIAINIPSSSSSSAQITPMMRSTIYYQYYSKYLIMFLIILFPSSRSFTYLWSSWN